MEDVDRTKALVHTRELCERHRLMGEAARDWESFEGWTSLDPEDFARGFRLSSDTKKKERISAILEEITELRKEAEEKVTTFLYNKEKELRSTLQDLEQKIRRGVSKFSTVSLDVANARKELEELRKDKTFAQEVRAGMVHVTPDGQQVHLETPSRYVEKVTLDKVKKGDWVYSANERDLRVQFRILEAENKRLERENKKLQNEANPKKRVKATPWGKMRKDQLQRQQRTSWPPKGLSCSFCYKPKKETQQMIAGADVYICDECVAICVGICEDNGLYLDRGEAETPPPVPEVLDLTATEMAEDIITRVQSFLEEDPEFAGSLWAAATKHLEKKKETP